MNYHNIIIKELKSQKSYQEQYYIDCDEDEKENVSISISAIDFCIRYFNIRFTNNLKQYNNDEAKAYDLYSAKKALEYINVYVEEFYFLNKEGTDYNYSFRKKLRDIIHVLHYEINNNIKEELRFENCHNGNIQCNNCCCYSCEIGCQECEDVNCWPMPEIIE